MKTKLVNITSAKYKVRPIRFTLLLLIMFVLILFLASTFGQNIFIIVLLIIVTLIPVLILFRKQLVDYLPKILSNNLREIDDRQKRHVRKNISKLVKEIGYYITITLALIGSLILIRNSNNDIIFNDMDDLGKFKTYHKILVALLLILVSGSIMFEL